MLRAPVIDVPKINVPTSRLSIYAGQRKGQQEVIKSKPAVISSVWQSEDKAFGVAFVNISDSQQAFRLEMDGKSHPLPSSGKIYRTDVSDRKEMGEFQESSIAQQIELAPQDAILLEIVENR